MELGIEPVCVEHDFDSLDDAILYALEHQDNRRNQTVAQKAVNAIKRSMLKEKIAARERQVFAGENRHAAQLPADAQGAKGEAAELVGTLITLTQMRDSTSLIVSA